MATVTFDTLKFVKSLEAAGVPTQQAEAISSAVRDSHESAEVATKADLRELELRLGARFERVEGDMRLLKWMLGVVVAGIVALVIKAFLHS